jgi:hypothetical protein
MSCFAPVRVPVPTLMKGLGEIQKLRGIWRPCSLMMLPMKLTPNVGRSTLNPHDEPVVASADLELGGA